MSAVAKIAELHFEGSRIVDEACALGLQPLGYLCSAVPLPLLSLGNLVPVRLRAPQVMGTPLADTYLSSVLCPYVRSLFEAALDGDLSSLSGWVFTSSCDHQRRLYDNLDAILAPPCNTILDVPHKRTDRAVAFFQRQILSLAATLARLFDVDVSPAAVDAAINEHNDRVALIRSLDSLRRRGDPVLSGADMHALLVAFHGAPPKLVMPLASELKEEAEQSPTLEPRARLLVVGSLIDDPRYIEVIESVGALVVGDRFCCGSEPTLRPISRTSDPYFDLANHYLKAPLCPRMMDDKKRRLRRVIEAARACRADGIVVEAMKFCDLWGMEAPWLISELRALGFGVLRLEREYAHTGEGQLRTRAQAFLESLGR